MGLGLPLHFAILSTFRQYKFITSVGFLITGDSPYVSLSLCCCFAFFLRLLSQPPSYHLFVPVLLCFPSSSFIITWWL